MMAEDELEIVTYSSFIRDLNESEISEVDIYSWGKDVDLTYVGKDGKLRATKGPFKIEEDELLLQTLESNEVAFTIHPESYGKESYFEIHHLSSILILGIPILLCVAVAKQASTIKSLAKALAEKDKAAERNPGN